MPERLIDKLIFKMLNENQGRGFRFSDVFKQFIREKTYHHQSDISKNLKILLEQKKIIAYQGATRKFYGVPLTKNGKKYLTINQGIEDETIELGK